MVPPDLLGAGPEALCGDLCIFTQHLGDPTLRQRQGISTPHFLDSFQFLVISQD